MSLIFKKETHQYFVNEEEKISVSKIISNYLGNDYKNVPKEILNNAIIKGNCIHKVAQLYFKNIHDKNVVEKIKDKITQVPVFNENILQYCNTLLKFLAQKFKKNECISEQMYYADIVAGTPDLVFKISIENNNDLYSIIDFKTYKIMTKSLLCKAELQLTAYHWLLTLNGFTLSNTHFIVWIRENIVETISVEITKEKLDEWENALNLYKKEILGEIKNESINS